MLEQEKARGTTEFRLVCIHGFVNLFLANYCRGGNVKKEFIWSLLTAVLQM